MLGGDTKNLMDGDTGDGLMMSVRMSECGDTGPHSGPGTLAYPRVNLNLCSDNIAQVTYL